MIRITKSFLTTATRRKSECCVSFVRVSLDAAALEAGDHDVVPVEPDAAVLAGDQICVAFLADVALEHARDPYAVAHTNTPGDVHVTI